MMGTVKYIMHRLKVPGAYPALNGMPPGERQSDIMASTSLCLLVDVTSVRRARRKGEGE